MRDASLRRSKILIIDDDTEVVGILRHILEVDGYREIRSTTNPRAAVRLFQEFQPDLVLLDLLMPGMSGLEVLAQLRAVIPAETYLPILVVTADSTRGTRREALARGASDFIAKPYDVTEIIARIGHMLETRFLHLQPLLESNRFLQSTLDALSSHVAILDARGIIVAVNTAWQRYTRENGCAGNVCGVGHDYLQLCDAAAGPFAGDTPELASGIRAVMAGQDDEFHLEYAYPGPRAQRWFILRVTRFNCDGPVRVVVAYENVTERKLAEEALRASEANMAAAQRIAHVGSWELDVTHVADGADFPLRWSDEMFRIAGYAPHAFEVTRQTLFRLIPAEEHGLVEQAMATAIRECAEYSIVHRLIRPDGEERIVRETGRVSGVEAAGQPLKMVGTTQDITEQRQADESIRVQAHMLNNVGQSVIAVDLGGRITYANRFAGELYGWLPGEMLGRAILEVIAPQTPPDLAREMMAQFQKGGGWSGEFLVQNRDGREFVTEVTDSPLLDHGGQVIGTVGISTEITARKQAEAALREAEEKSRAIVDNALDGIFQNTPEGVVLSANPALAHMLGFDNSEELISARADLEGQSYAEPSKRREFQRMLEEKGVVTNFEYEIKRKDGSLICVSENTRLVRDAAGRALYYEGSVRDVTARKRAEAALAASEARFSTAFEYAPMGMALVSTDGRWLKVNQSLCNLLGYSRAELTGTYFRDVTHVESRADDDDIMFRLLAGEIDFSRTEKRYIHKAGHDIWVVLGVSIMREADGLASGFVSQVQDITARKQAEEELFRSRETLRSILDNIPQRVFWKDRQSVYLGCNRAFASDMGCSDPSEVIGKTNFELRSKATAETYRADDRSVMDLDLPKSGFEEPGITPDGSLGWIRTSKVPLHDPQGQVTGVLGTYEDVTEHKLAKLEIERLNVELEQRVARRTEDLFAATQEAERANRAKSEFLSRISHELRTPMNAILGFGQLLEMEENLGPEPRESIEQIINAGRHLLILINEVLDISSAESGSMTLSLEPVAADEIVAESLGLVRPLGATLEVELELASSLAGHGKVLADRQRLKQVLLNLLANAIKYNHHGGKVIVECVPGPAADPPTLRIRVKDNGPGISAEKLTRLFKPFDRLDVERTRTDIAGTGLGLALSKRLLELMGGGIGVESALGEGSVFWIELPLVAGLPDLSDPGAVRPVFHPAMESGPVRTLLYIEDDDSNIRLMTRILARRPAIQLLTARTGALGLVSARELRPDFILLDLNLPNGSGDEVMAGLRADPVTAAIPVVIISADASSERSQQLSLSGACAFLTKPLEVRTLLAVIDRFIGVQTPQGA